MGVGEGQWLVPELEKTHKIKGNQGLESGAAGKWELNGVHLWQGSTQQGGGAVGKEHDHDLGIPQPWSSLFLPPSRWPHSCRPHSCQPHSISTHHQGHALWTQSHLHLLGVDIIYGGVADTQMISTFNSLGPQTSILDLHTLPGRVKAKLPYTAFQSPKFLPGSRQNFLNALLVVFAQTCPKPTLFSWNLFLLLRNLG